jgi:hypothetical protein
MTPAAIESIQDDLVFSLAMGALFYPGKLVLLPSLCIILDTNPKVKYHKMSNYLHKALEIAAFRDCSHQSLVTFRGLFSFAQYLSRLNQLFLYHMAGLL